MNARATARGWWLKAGMSGARSRVQIFLFAAKTGDRLQGSSIKLHCFPKLTVQCRRPPVCDLKVMANKRDFPGSSSHGQ